MSTNTQAMNTNALPQSETATSLPNQVRDRHGAVLLVDDRVVITGTIQKFINDGVGYVQVRVDGAVSPESWFSFDPAILNKGEFSPKRLPDDVLANALRSAEQAIRGMQQRINALTDEKRTIERTLRDTIVAMIRPLFGNGGGDAAPPQRINSCYQDRVADHIESFVKILEEEPAQPPTRQQCLDAEFQAGRNLARENSPLPDLASDAAREGYDYERLQQAKASGNQL